MILETMPEVNRLSPAEQLQLASEIWDTLAAQPGSIPVSREHLEELDQRMEAYRLAPDQVTTWEAIRKKVLIGKTGSE